MVKRILILFNCIILFSDLSAQQLPLYNQYFINPLVYNPAMYGVNSNPTVYIIRRQQWSQFEGAPETYCATFDTYVKPAKIGFGFGAYSEKIHLYERKGGTIGLSSRLSISDDTKILFGLGAGMQQNTLNYNGVIVNDSTEDFLVSKPAGKALFDANFGVYLITKVVKVGISMPQLLQSAVSYPTDGTVGKSASYKMARNYMVNAKYVHKFDKRTSLSPLLMARVVSGAPLQYDLNVIYENTKWGWVAVCYKSNYAVVANAGIKIAGVSLGVAYDVGFSKINKGNGGSTELLLGYTYSPPKKKEFREIPKY